MRPTGQVRVVANVRHQAEFRCLANALFSKSQKAHIQVIQQLLLYAKFPVKQALASLFHFWPAEFITSDESVFGPLLNERNAFVVSRQLSFVGLCGASKPVVRRITEYDDDSRLALHLLRSIEFLSHFGEVQLDIARIVPAREGIG